MKPYKVIDGIGNSHGRHMRYHAALAKAEELAAKFKKTLTVLRNWSTDEGKSLATVYAAGGVWFEPAGRFCDAHDDCHADFLLGQACFSRLMSEGRLEEVAKKPALVEMNGCFFWPLD